MVKDMKIELINRVSGVRGVFLKEFDNYYGTAIMVMTSEGREYYDPKHEWIEL